MLEKSFRELLHEHEGIFSRSCVLWRKKID